LRHDAQARRAHRRYLSRLDRELGDLPRARREEVVEEIAEHIDQAGVRTEVDTLNVLERLGDPAEIAAEARSRFGIEPRRAARSEIAALVLLLVGGFFLAVGWLVGLVLLWTSTIWSTRDKIIGTLVFPGGLFVVPLLLASITLIPDGGHDRCGTTASVSSSGPGNPKVQTACHHVAGASSFARAAWIALLVLLVLGPFLTTIYLAWRMRARSTPAITPSPPDRSPGQVPA
jgi:hypothetical protein